MPPRLLAVLHPLRHRVAAAAVSVLLATAPLTHAATISVPAGGDVNAALSRASSGDTVSLAAGTYDVTSLNLKSGVTLRGVGGNGDVKSLNNATVLRGGVVNGRPKLIRVNKQISDFTLYKLNFENLRLELRGPDRSRPMVRGIVDRCRFRVTANNVADDATVLFLYSTDCWVKNSRISADLPSGSMIEGIEFARSTRGHAEGNDVRGALRNAVRVNGGSGPSENWSRGTYVRNNRLVRSGSGPADHGIYAHQYLDVVITGNKVAGWADDAAGQSVKLKDGTRAKVVNNDFWTSGVIVRSAEENLPNGNDRVLISNNRVHQGSINVWSPDRTYNGTFVRAVERSIRIENNRIYQKNVEAVRDIRATDFNRANGWLGRWSNGNAKPGGVHGNRTRTPNRLASGIYQTGNAISVGTDPTPSPGF